MTNDTYTTMVDVSFNANVMNKVLTAAIDDLPDDEAVQELVDTLYFSALILMTMLDAKQAGQLTGRILTDALYQAAKANKVFV